MIIEEFVSRSIGEWRSMRSGHSLVFQQFEEVLSKIRIESIEANDSKVMEILRKRKITDNEIVSPFQINWEAESNWEPDNPNDQVSGSCILIPIPISENNGHIIRSIGYAEAQGSISTYSITSDGTFTLRSKYDNSIADERIWFISENVRCRSSVIRTSEGKGVLQTSYASEIRLSN